VKKCFNPVQCGGYVTNCDLPAVLSGGTFRLYIPLPNQQRRHQCRQLPPPIGG